MAFSSFPDETANQLLDSFLLKQKVQVAYKQDSLKGTVFRQTSMKGKQSINKHFSLKYYTGLIIFKQIKNYTGHL